MRGVLNHAETAGTVPQSGRSDAGRVGVSVRE
jgi:hypothetical protein